ncbi:MAG: methyltransferase domain-containing protein [Candidatus Korarchaeota archaeon]
MNVTRDAVIFQTGERYVEIPKSEIKQACKNPRRVYALSQSELIPLSIAGSNGKYYQLTLFENCITPTIEISGIHMHRVVVDPLYVDAKSKIQALNPNPRSSVLEVCTGLGYTTYWLLRSQCKVVTIEKSKEVLELASWNPWSRHLEGVELILGDASEVLQHLPDNEFDFVVHDPPRIALSPELYTEDFYKELHRVMKRAGRLLHYVGEPKRKKGKHYHHIRSISNLLRNSGFSIIRYDPFSQSILAVCIKR